MAETTGIEWCDHTFNPWIGCTKLSGACDHCYAETLMDTRYHRVDWGPGKPRLRTSAANWREPLRWNKAAAAAGVRRRVFCASLADVFDVEVDDEWRVDLIFLIVETPHLDWLLLTKRPKPAAEFFRKLGMVPPNVWLGTTVEDQKMADLRIPILLSIPAKVRFLSCEPLLGPVDLRCVAPTDSGYINALSSSTGPNLDWIIAGGESGPKARPSHPDWFRALRDQCATAGVPFFFKQWGEWTRWEPKFPADVDYLGPDGSSSTNPGLDREPMVKVGKKAAGALLNGREHREFPTW